MLTYGLCGTPLDPPHAHLWLYHLSDVTAWENTNVSKTVLTLQWCSPRPWLYLRWPQTSIVWQKIWDQNFGPLIVTFCCGRALGGSRWPDSSGTWRWCQGDVQKCPDGVRRCRYWLFTQHLFIAFCFKLAMGEPLLNSGHHFGLYAASSDSRP